MTDSSKTNKEPIAENSTFKQRIQELEQSESDRKRAEELISDTETRYRILFEHSPDGIVIIDPATARLLDFNETAHLQLGYSRKEFSPLSIGDFEIDETPEETKAHIEKVIREGRSDFETRHRTKHGEIKNIHVTAQVTRFAGNTVYHCIWRDITDRKRVEEALRESEEKLRILFNNDLTAIYIFELETLRLLDVNDAFVRTYGYSREELLGGMRLLDISAEPEESASAVRKAFEKNAIFIPLRWHQKEDGTVFPVEIVGGGYVWPSSISSAWSAPR
jgi:PAS domain S-box-containing protein